jgi:hypothetical protein
MVPDQQHAAGGGQNGRLATSPAGNAFIVTPFGKACCVAISHGIRILAAKFSVVGDNDY